MKKKSEGFDPSATSKAVGHLLRLANSDLKDASLLSAGRSPANAPALVHLAFDRLMLAVIATERGWPLPAAAELSLIPDANPLKATLIQAAKQRPALESFPAIGRDGNAEPVPDRDGIRASILGISALLKDMASRFEVDLLGEEPAGRASPIRPAPVPPRPLPSKAAPEAIPAAPKPATPPASRTLAKPAKVATGPDHEPLPPRTEARAVAGRSPIELSAASNSTASTAFWALMDAWNVEDADALALIGHPGGLTKKGNRPRFKLTGDEVPMFKGLTEIASALTSLQLKPHAWLSRPIKDAPFAGATPIAYLTDQRLTGVQSTIRFILRQGLKLSVSDKG